jgi:hypothetical protein
MLGLEHALLLHELAMFALPLLSGGAQRLRQERGVAPDVVDAVDDKAL